MLLLTLVASTPIGRRPMLRRGGGNLLREPRRRDLDVGRVGVVADVAPAVPGGGDGGGTGPEEGIEHHVADIGVEAKEPLGKLEGEGCRVPDASCALGPDL